ncbi:extracellular solute-binding protein, partial [Hungatella sp. SL.1.14]
MKRVVCLSMAAVLAVSTAACGKKETETDGNGEAPATIRIVTSVDAQFQVDNNPVIEAIEKAANVKLEIEVPPINNYLDRLNVIMASGELPDIVFLQETSDSSFYKWADDGLLIPLDEYLPSLPNVTA